MSAEEQRAERNLGCVCLVLKAVTWKPRLLEAPVLRRPYLDRRCLDTQGLFPIFLSSVRHDSLVRGLVFFSPFHPFMESRTFYPPHTHTHTYHEHSERLKLVCVHSDRQEQNWDFNPDWPDSKACGLSAALVVSKRSSCSGDLPAGASGGGLAVEWPHSVHRPRLPFQTLLGCLTLARNAVDP